MVVRVGAIYALERISKDSPPDHWTIMEVLTAYVREKATAPWALAVESGDAGRAIISAKLPVGLNTQQVVDLNSQLILTGLLGKGGPVKLRAETDIQAILTVLGRRSEEARKQEVAEGRCLDLAVTDLRGALLNQAHLEHADLRGADLRLASLRNAKLHGCYLHQANLQGAQGLTQPQLNVALGDERTVLPQGEGLNPPSHWLTPEDPSPTSPPPSQPPPPEPPPKPRTGPR